ncbi:aldehyde dehydrogenase family protein [Thalassotalea psychrophila]|uniref:Aldehyde dehydrogenase family protein n=1 Tax=Thalassotalea psychrophila TaxID=3065647 RepID=A0ABY9TTG6_9GAMM|nr:aldehyde dehydrogenase family protein [Colwelliaceae bacterium SQ149]
MRIYDKFYINGQWVAPIGNGTDEVINPANGEVSAKVPYGNTEDVNAAVSAAKNAFSSWSQTSAAERAEFLRKIAAEGERRNADLTQTVVDELGMPIQHAAAYQVDPLAIICESYADKAKHMEESKEIGNSVIVQEPIGVCAMINPWNYPIWQMIGKVAPAIAAGCTMVVKAASQTPSHLFMFAEICDAVGLPAGVFNIVHGSGREIGTALSSHPDVDMVTFTGSTAAGVQVTNAAAPAVKRVCLELGGKSPFIITEEADLDAAVDFGINDVMVNTGQTCNAMTRMIVHESVYDKAVELAKFKTEALLVGDPNNPEVFVGPMSSAGQKQTVLDYIDQAVAQGANLVTGGTEMPEGMTTGHYVLPTVFSNVTNDMVIAQEEVFGPVLVMIKYSSVDQAVEIANDTPYGLAASVWAGDKNKATAIARRIRAGQCAINGGDANHEAPFGGYKESGNGREFGMEGLHEYCELKAMQY